MGPSLEQEADVRWLAGTGGVLEAELPADLTYELLVQVRLGALRGEWTQQLAAPVAGTLVATVAPPAEAFLDVLAEDYVTSLDVRIIARDEAGDAVMELAAPAAFLSWPGGAGSAAVVWDVDTMKVEAPAGILDEALRASFGDLTGIGRVMVPIYFTTPPPADDDEGA